MKCVPCMPLKITISVYMNGEEKNIEMQGPFCRIRRQTGSFPTDNEPKRDDRLQSIARR